MLDLAFSALILLAVHQEGHQICKKYYSAITTELVRDTRFGRVNSIQCNSKIKCY